MRILVIGAGGREHALAWRLAREPQVTQVCVAPGNAGVAGGKLGTHPAADVTGWLQAAVTTKADLVVVGPEGPLAAGLADRLRAGGIPTVGPSAAAARLEGSKAHAKEIMNAAGVPTPDHVVVSDVAAAQGWFADRPPPYVLKADGLAGGKGVVVAEDAATGQAALRDLLAGAHGDASRTVVIEQYVAGTELSLYALCAGTQAVAIGTAQDHKRLLAGGRGPNTGGMGAVSPAPQEHAGQVTAAGLVERFVLPVLEELAARGTPYHGFMYPGLVVTPANEVMCLEYNCRLGDPETQVLALRWGDGVVAALAQMADGGQPTWPGLAQGHAVGIVVAGSGYPQGTDTWLPLTLPVAKLPDMMFHGMTRRDPDGTLLAGDGRAVSCVAMRPRLEAACRAARELAAAVEMPHGQWRRDIGNCVNPL